MAGNQNSGRYTPVEILQRIARLAREKRSQCEIAKQTGLHRNTVSRLMPKDAERLPRGRPPG